MILSLTYYFSSLLIWRLWKRSIWTKMRIEDIRASPLNTSPGPFSIWPKKETFQMVKLESMKPKSKSWGNPVWCLVSPPPHATTCELDRYPSLLLGHSRPSHKVQVPRLLLLSGTVRRPVFHFSLLSWIFPLIYQVAEVWTSMKSEHLKARLGAYFHRLPPSTLVKEYDSILCWQRMPAS